MYLTLLLAALIPALATVATAAPFAYIANREGSKVDVIDTATDALVTSVPIPAGVAPQSVAISPDGTRIFVGSPLTNNVRVIDAYTNTVVKTIAVFGGTISLAITPDGTEVWGAGGSSSVKTIAVGSETFAGLILAAGFINFPNFVSFDPTGATAFVSDVDSITAVDVLNRSPLAGTTSRFVQNAVAHPDGRLFAPSGVGRPSFINDAIYVIDQATMLDLRVLDVPPVPFHAALSPDASRLYVTHPNGGGVTAIDTATEMIVTNGPLAGFDSWGLQAHPDGTRLYVNSVPTGTTSGGVVHVLDAGTLAVLTQIPVGGRPIGFGQFIGPVATCGDGQVTFPETCDDGNTASGDCCSAACQFEAAGSACMPDANACTADECDGAGSCSHPNNTEPCDDDDACTVGDACSGGGCAGTPITSCADADGCCPMGCSSPYDDDCPPPIPVISALGSLLLAGLLPLAPWWLRRRGRTQGEWQ